MFLLFINILCVFVGVKNAHMFAKRKLTNFSVSLTWVSECIRIAKSDSIELRFGLSAFKYACLTKKVIKACR